MSFKNDIHKTIQIGWFKYGQNLVSVPSSSYYKHATTHVHTGRLFEPEQGNKEIAGTGYFVKAEL